MKKALTKKALTMMLAFGVSAGLALADTAANERFRMKTGRDLPSVEKAQKAAVAASRAAATVVIDTSGMAPKHNEAEERFFLKYGRHTPIEERRLAALQPAVTPEFRGMFTEAEERRLRKTGQYPGR